LDAIQADGQGGSWREVYRGAETLCRIGGLHPGSRYLFR